MLQQSLKISLLFADLLKAAFPIFVSYVPFKPLQHTVDHNILYTESFIKQSYNHNYLRFETIMFETQIIIK